jgi:hypothetical protein
VNQDFLDRLKNGRVQATNVRRIEVTTREGQQHLERKRGVWKV